MNRRILNRIPVRGFSRYSLNEGVNTNGPVAVLASRLKSFMKKNGYNIEQMKKITKSALDLLFDNVKVKSSFLTKKQQEVLKSHIIGYIEGCIEDSGYGANEWTYGHFEFDANNIYNSIWDHMSDCCWYEDEDIYEYFNPKGKFDTMDDWWDSLSPAAKKDFADYANAIIFNYFKGDTNASFEDYC